MSSSNFNMYAGAFLGTVFVMMSVGILGEAIFHEEDPEQAGFAITVEESSGGGEATADAEPTLEPIGPLLADADIAAGENVFKKCQACHTDDKGGANKVGPNLWGVVNRPVASHEGFKYSSALIAFAEGGTVWDYEHLNAFTHKPKDLVPGTAMGFAGLKKVEDRANLVAYLRTMADTPEPLPSAEAPAEEAAPAAEDATATETPAAEPAAMDQPAEETPAATDAATTEEQPAAEEAPAATEEAAPAEETAPATEGATQN
ncbi:MAG: cytochrome c family protein [Ahrensia sp.]|nr:cytochrome c family protein [Ahrensia sp.]